jgi:hypothetical protein
MARPLNSNDLLLTHTQSFPFTRLLHHADDHQFTDVIIFIVFQENIHITGERRNKYASRLIIIDTVKSICSSQFPNPVLQTERFSKHFEN